MKRRVALFFMLVSLVSVNLLSAGKHKKKKKTEGKQDNAGASTSASASRNRPPAVVPSTPVAQVRPGTSSSTLDVLLSAPAAISSTSVAIPSESAKKQACDLIRRFGGVCPVTSSGCKELASREGERFHACLNSSQGKRLLSFLAEVGLCYFLSYMTSNLSISDTLKYRLPLAARAFIDPGSVGGVLRGNRVDPATRFDGAYGVVASVWLFYFLPLIYSYILTNGVHALEDLYAFITGAKPSQSTVPQSSGQKSQEFCTIL
jgi:hypothetical protein